MDRVSGRQRTRIAPAGLPRTHAQELDERLTSEGFSRDVVATTLDHFEEIGALSDARYADILARSKLAAGWSRSRIERRLNDDGVSRELVQAILDELTNDADDLERACALITHLDLGDPKVRNRALGRLARRGFSPSQAYAALDHVRSRVDLSA